MGKASPDHRFCSLVHTQKPGKEGLAGNALWNPRTMTLHKNEKLEIQQDIMLTRIYRSRNGNKQTKHGATMVLEEDIPLNQVGCDTSRSV